MRCCSLANAVFFERAAFALEEAPDRIVRYGDAALGQDALELMQRQVWNLFDLCQNKVAVPLEAASLIASELGRCGTARLLQALSPLHHRGGGEVILSRDRPAGFTRRDGFSYALSEVVRVRFRHAGWPPSQHAC